MKFKVGDKVRVKSKEENKYTTYGIERGNICVIKRIEIAIEKEGIIGYIDYKNVELVEEILDETERKYLADVIRPFKNSVKYIYKQQSCANKNQEFIGIILEKDVLKLPYFTAGTMYKGMETDRNYTLEELGL